MIERHILTREQCLYAIQNQEFDSGVISSKKNVLIIMTQDWCPQWIHMKSWIYSLEAPDELDIYELIYNKTDFFKEFVVHKESVWDNDQIPYLRYYQNGKLIAESNYKSPKGITEIFSSINNS